MAMSCLSALQHSIPFTDSAFFSDMHFLDVCLIEVFLAECILLSFPIPATLPRTQSQLHQHSQLVPRALLLISSHHAPPPLSQKHSGTGGNYHQPLASSVFRSAASPGSSPRSQQHLSMLVGSPLGSTLPCHLSQYLSQTTTHTATGIQVPWLCTSACPETLLVQNMKNGLIKEIGSKKIHTGIKTEMKN